MGVSHSGSGTNFLFLSHPAYLVSPLAQTEKTLPGCFGVAGGSTNSPHPWCLRSPHPCFFQGQGDAGIGYSLHTHAPSFQFFSSTNHSCPGHPKHKIELGSCGAKGPCISLDKQAAPAMPRPQEWLLSPSFVLGPPHTPRSWEMRLETGRGHRPCPALLVSCPQAPLSLALANRPSPRRLLRILAMLCPP